MKKISKADGFSIVEVILYIGLFSIFLVVLTNMLISVIDVQLESAASSHVSLDGRYILSRMLYDVGRAQDIVTPSTVGASTGSLGLTIGGVLNTYSLSNSNLLVASSGATTQLNGFDTSVSGLQFTRLGKSGGKNTVTISFTLSSGTTTAQGTKSASFSETVGLR